MSYKRGRGMSFNDFFYRRSITTVLIISNVALFLLFTIFFSFYPSSINSIALKPSDIVSGNNLWTLITSMFMHAGIFHLFVNMFSLFFLGNFTEQIIGRKRFVWLYFLSGIIGALFFVGFAYVGQFIPRGDIAFGNMDSIAVGASGALFGLLGLLAVLVPKKKVYLIVGPLIIIILQVIIGSVLAGAFLSIFNIVSSILIFFMIFAMFSPNPKLRKISLPLGMPFWLTPIVAIVPLVIIGFIVELPIGNTAHFGGLVVGLIYGYYLRTKYSNKIKLLNRMVR